MFEHVHDLKRESGNRSRDEDSLLQRCATDESLKHDCGGNSASECEEKARHRGGKGRLIDHGSGSRVSGVVLNRSQPMDFEGSFDLLARGMLTRVR